MKCWKCHKRMRSKVFFGLDVWWCIHCNLWRSKAITNEDYKLYTRGRRIER